MTKNIAKILTVCVGVALTSCSSNDENSATTNPENQKSFKLAWSPYTGWEPIAYMVDSGILKKHADKHGIEIQVDKLNDYVESINLYTSGEYDCVSVTNMDALTMPAVGGVDSTFILPTDFSNGNDAIVSKGAQSIPELKGATINLVEFSVSHYLLARALQENNLSEKDLTVTNSSDAQLGALFTASDSANVVTWNPIVNSIKSQPGAKVLFDSSMIPGEVIDTLLVKTESNDAFKQALTDAWYETMAVMQKNEPEAMKIIAASAGGSLEDYQQQLATTEMFYNKADAAKFFKSNEVKTTMEFVRTFAYDKGLFGKDAPNKDFIGIEFPDGSIIGDKENVKLRFSAQFLK
ncbi:putative urea ABC transporter substrate-binding protein [Rubritalea tangerina]|uniref:Urea ABC transporter substrate-binding protein n=1 Tax=Rubritalea tangerina TaxID=430798 RepID=A0ABW4ZAL9_9BACT